ncbi:hypothetical protein Sa4125_39480 [Aureimonas sp. SA4125]|uniref:cell envelope integrity protein TolA n=1 Tax=Aureimonas sp. SA4125 TaxID=2826993 RepID=UPI001CC49B37|nr:TonB family protein [Aureimonas sp. SA4125]BDA86406.1 hypothetical protein Sa4125_39480 [Aureimonas sp. SA4125]
MTEAPDLRALEASGSGAWRWGLAASVVAAAYGGLVWLAFAMPPPEGTIGEINEAVMIELEPVTAEVEAPPPAPEPVEEPAPEVAEAPAEPVAPPPEPAPEPLPTPEPVVEEPPPEVTPPPPEPPVTRPPPEPPLPEPPPPEPEIVEPEPLPEPEEIVPDLPAVETEAEAILNAPIPMARPTPPRPQPIRKEVRKPPPPKKKTVAEKPARREVTRATPRRTATTERSDSAPARNASSAPRVSPASWQRRAVSHFRKFRRKVTISTRGVARVAVTIDRGGRVVSARLASSSGNGDFDAEAIALVRRASPIPAPPEGVGGRTVSLVVPVNM